MEGEKDGERGENGEVGVRGKKKSIEREKKLKGQ